MARLHNAQDDRLGIIRQPCAQEGAAAPAREAQLEFVRVVEEKQQAALRVGQLNGRIHQHRQNFLEGRRAVQHLRHLEQQAQVLELWNAAFAGLAEFLEQLGQHHLARDKSQLVGVRHSQADLISALEGRGGDALAVDEGSVAASRVFDGVAVFVLNNLRVPPGNAAVQQH